MPFPLMFLCNLYGFSKFNRLQGRHRAAAEIARVARHQVIQAGLQEKFDLIIDIDDAHHKSFHEYYDAKRNSISLEKIRREN